MNDRASQQGDSSSALPRIATALSAKEVIERLDHAARRGRLAGFEPEGSDGFRASAFAAPFDHVVEGAIRDAGGERSIEFSIRMLWKTPVV
ncbi:MAG: hypothetical protein VYC34_01875, partial [Planctomycetota bacterium]|nr:hypothetical protein [Planctomycetota bacterium]